MKYLYLDIFSGISGDMFIGALLDLGVDVERLKSELRKLSLDGYELRVTRASKSSIAGVKFDVALSGMTAIDGDASDGEFNNTQEQHRPAEAAQVHSQKHDHADAHGPGDHDHLAGCELGPHGGPLVATSYGRVELSVFETGVPPRFRLYFFDNQGHPTRPPPAKQVVIETRRRDGKRQIFRFKQRPEYLEATTELPEPHEFRLLLKVTRGRKIERHESVFVEAHHHSHPAGEPSGQPTNGGTGVVDFHAPHAHGRNWADIRDLIQGSELSDWVKQKAVAVFQRIADAEGRIHGQSPEQVHFHEVGAIDSIVDIVGTCAALEILQRPRILAGPVVDGTGWVNCAHGRFPVPTMATLAILGARGIPVTQCEEPRELVTPTGAALLAEFVEEFGPMTNLVAEKVGYGLGTRDNQTRPNVLRAILGEMRTTEPAHLSKNDWETDRIAVLETNLDDCPAEVLGFVVEQALADGALDVFNTPVQMKKNRPGVLLTVLCAASDADRFTEMLLRETTAFGVRRQLVERRKLRRELVKVKTDFGEVTVKLGKLNGKIVQAAPEFESCRELARQHHVTLHEIYEIAKHGLPK